MEIEDVLREFPSKVWTSLLAKANRCNTNSRHYVNAFCPYRSFDDLLIARTSWANCML